MLCDQVLIAICRVCRTGLGVAYARISAFRRLLFHSHSSLDFEDGWPGTTHAPENGTHRARATTRHPCFVRHQCTRLSSSCMQDHRRRPCTLLSSIGITVCSDRLPRSLLCLIYAHPQHACPIPAREPSSVVFALLLVALPIVAVSHERGHLECALVGAAILGDKVLEDAGHHQIHEEDEEQEDDEGRDLE